MAKEEERWMREALRLAAEALERGEVPVGAVIVRKGEMVASAANRRETDRDATAHAEVLAIREACRKLGTRRLAGCTLYVTLEPCPMCAGAIGMARMEGVVYGASDKETGCCGSVYDLLADPVLFTGSGGGISCRCGVLAEECATLLREFFETRRIKE